jgi:predicted nucleic acid-binding protein
MVKSDHYLIADTSGLISLASPTDRNHQAATAAANDLRGQQQAILIPYDVFAETMNVAGRRLGHSNAVALASYLRTTSLFAIFDVNDPTRQLALDRFDKLPESISYTDCMVMAVADEYHTRRIFGFDEDFSQRGYSILRKEAEEAAA